MEVHAPGTPGGYSQMSMATLGRTVVLFGGSASVDVPANETWTFDGSTWTAVTSPTAPSPRIAPSMATVGDRVVLFGGYDGSQGLNDTWTFDGASWTEVTTPIAPDARYDASRATLP